MPSVFIIYSIFFFFFFSEVTRLLNLIGWAIERGVNSLTEFIKLQNSSKFKIHQNNVRQHFSSLASQMWLLNWVVYHKNRISLRDDWSSDGHMS